MGRRAPNKSKANRTKGKRPRISKQDLNSFFDMSVGDEEVDIEEAISALSNALNLLQSSASKGGSKNPLPEHQMCREKHEEFLNLVKYKTVYHIVKYFVTGGLVTLAGIFLLVYSNLYNPLRETIRQKEQMEIMLFENRKILKLMGKEKGWEIEEKKPGYKTPWETGLDEGDEKEGGKNHE